MKHMYFRKLVLLFVFPFLILFCCVTICKGSETPKKQMKVEDVVAYESVCISHGDSLWTIAEANLDQPTDAQIQAYVDEITKLNHLSSNTIHAGNYILIPRYRSLSKQI